MQNSTSGAPIRAVLFDWDGTVADTRPGIFNSVRYAIGQYGIADKPDDELRYFIGPPLYDGFEHVFGVSPELANELTDTYRVYYRDKGIFECNVYEGVGDLLRELHDAGVKTAVVSSKPKEFLDRLVEHFGLAEHLDAVVGPAMDNHNSNKTVLVNQALKELMLLPSTVAMIGDRHFDMEGAKAAGVSAVGVLYGYGTEEELCKAGADAICDQVADLRGFLLQHCGVS
ncbi:MAG: HAD hydrolase-like protein [Clostridia bacterium]|nr:HAD hydrolase-like protein [Clostridia bacterium]MBQ5480611.1 HAD hydrolase-like protein [Clostridia bacterium]MBQ5685220.1 HAD hydrolase-like protein [Clostridia bacterium]MBQ6445695.1 HAD hydrolase-like protein [Clostridia bacterium]